MHTRIKRRPVELPAFADADAGAAYDQAGDDYLAYADGNTTDLYAFGGGYAYGDRQVWRILEAKLLERRAAGARDIRILDAGCGPGTWLRRLVRRAHALGFTSIAARGFDLAGAQIRRARVLSRDVTQLPGVELGFEVADLTRPFAEADGAVDLTLCLYCVLNHVPVADLPKVCGELARVTAGDFITTVRAAGSTPTIFVDSMEKARRFAQDHRRNRCEVELNDGRRIAFNAHLFTADELRALVAERFDIEALRGLDVFHGRFAPDPRWNPSALIADRSLCDELGRLEERYAGDPRFIDRAAHLLLVARRASPLAPRNCEGAWQGSRAPRFSRNGT